LGRSGKKVLIGRRALEVAKLKRQHFVRCRERSMDTEQYGLRSLEM